VYQWSDHCFFNALFRFLFNKYFHLLDFYERKSVNIFILKKIYDLIKFRGGVNKDPTLFNFWIDQLSKNLIWSCRFQNKILRSYFAQIYIIDIIFMEKLKNNYTFSSLKKTKVSNSKNIFLNKSFKFKKIKEKQKNILKKV
jgi:hypothetical protein